MEVGGINDAAAGAKPGELAVSAEWGWDVVQEHKDAFEFGWLIFLVEFSA